MAVFINPLASYGVVGTTTCKPGTCMNHDSMICECWAASSRAGPQGRRITRGTLAWPPVM